MFLEKFRFYIILISNGTDVAYTGLGRLFHHISELPCQHELAFSGHEVYLDLQGITSHTGPGQPANDSDLIKAVLFLVGVFRPA